MEMIIANAIYLKSTNNQRNAKYALPNTKLPEEIVRIAFILDEGLEHKPETVLDVLQGIDVSMVGEVGVVGEEKNGVGKDIIGENVGHHVVGLVHLDHFSTLGDVLQ